MYDYITKLCKSQAELIINHVNPNVHGVEQGDARNRKFGSGQVYNHSAD
jgi:hypothetical protein